jgi:hypothetical protein
VFETIIFPSKGQPFCEFPANHPANQPAAFDIVPKQNPNVTVAKTPSMFTFQDKLGGSTK